MWPHYGWGRPLGDDQAGVKWISARPQPFENEKPEQYQPLVSYPGLFLTFARLAEGDGLDSNPLDSERNAAAALQWAHGHGTLGLTTVEDHGRLGASTRGGRGDTVESFADEAWIAHGALTVYEAATAPEGPDMETLRSYDPSYGFFTQEPERAQEWGMQAVANVVQAKVSRHASLALYQRDGGYVQGYDFANLLGAMWLQMFWLLTADKQPRKCRRCRRVIVGRKNKFYCDDKCKNAYNYRTRTKPRREAAHRAAGCH